MVFTENNQSEGIIVRLVTLGTNDQRLLFLSSLTSSRRRLYLDSKINYFFINWLIDLLVD